MNLTLSDIREYYEGVDKHLQEIPSRISISCCEGCDACCHYLTLITTLEGYVLAHRVFSEPNWKNWVGVLQKASRKVCYPGIDAFNYGKKEIPCPFLKNHRCIFYDDRPIVCRALLVISPTHRCWEDLRSEDGVSLDVVDTGRITMRTILLSSDLSKGIPALAPIPLMTLYSMMKIAESNGMDQRDREFLRKAYKEVPVSVVNWVKTYGGGLEGMTPEQRILAFENAAKEMNFWKKI